jgi:hypothetical protein
MARQPTWGTPGRSEHYQKLRAKYVLLSVGLLLGGVVFVALAFFQLVGLRSPLSPGHVTSGHSGVDSRCEACHAGRQANDLRCQRCHDSSGAGRLDLGAHVFFGSGDPHKAVQAGSRACARCHVEHRGRDTHLASVDEAHCLECHAARDPEKAGQAFRIGSLEQHPEFRVLRDKLRGEPRLLFSHKRHMKEMVKEGAAGEWDACARCHAPEVQGRDLQRIGYDQHCARCHNESELTMEPVAARDVLADVPLPGAVGALNRSPDGATVQRLGIRHKDDWILYNLRKLQWELYPDAYGRDRGALLARVNQLERRLYQAQPLSGLIVESLRDREAAVREELRRLETRAQALASKSPPDAGLERLAEVAAAAALSGDEGARALAESASREAGLLRQAPSKPVAMPIGEFDLRRQELFGLLDALAAADPGRKRTVEDLRRRLLALSHGETTADAVLRARAQRRLDLDRIADEISLRRTSVPVEARALPEQVALEQQLKELRDQLGKFYTFAGTPPSLSVSDRTAKVDSLLKLSGAGSVAAGKGERCAKCHVLQEGSLVPQRAAQPVMVRATFAHRSHLDAALPEPSLVSRIVGSLKGTPAAAVGPGRNRCAYCHEAIVGAGDAPRTPSIPGVPSCRECHRAGAVRQDCQLCHRYHPAGAPS